MDYVICSYPRTGSQLLADSLALIGAGRPREYLCARCAEVEGFAGSGFLSPDPVAYFQRIRQANTVDGVFGIKIHFSQLSELVGAGDALIDLFPDARYLSISRRRTLRQAVSHARAAQSGVWSESLRPLRRARFNHLRIVKHLLFAAQDVERWERFYERHRITPLRLVYEDLDERYEDTMRRVIDFLGLSAAVPPKPLARQADLTTEEWVDRSVRFLRGDGVVMRMIRRIAKTW